MLREWQHVLYVGMAHRVHVSAEGVRVRDEMVFDMALELKTPVCMLLSGGYARGNWRVVLDSLTNLLTKYNLIQTC